MCFILLWHVASNSHMFVRSFGLSFLCLSRSLLRISMVCSAAAAAAAGVNTIIMFPQLETGRPPVRWALHGGDPAGHHGGRHQVGRHPKPDGTLTRTGPRTGYVQRYTEPASLAQHATRVRTSACACLFAFVSASLIVCLFACTCLHCDFVDVGAYLNLVFCFVRGDVRCSGSCLAMILCFVVLALFRLRSCLRCTTFAPFCSLLHHHEQIMTLENSQEENLISCFTSGGGNARQFFLRCTTHRDAPVKLHYMLQCDAFFSSELASVFALFFCVHARQFLLRCEDCRLGCWLCLDLMWGNARHFFRICTACWQSLHVSFDSLLLFPEEPKVSVETRVNDLIDRRLACLPCPSRCEARTFRLLQCSRTTTVLQGDRRLCSAQ